MKAALTGTDTFPPAAAERWQGGEKKLLSATAGGKGLVSAIATAALVQGQKGKDAI